MCVGILDVFLSVHLHAKEDMMREEAALAAKHLSMQCSDGDAIQHLASSFFAVLNGT